MNPVVTIGSPEELRARVASLERERLDMLGELEDAYERLAGSVNAARQENEVLYRELRSRMVALERQVTDLTSLADVTRSISSLLQPDPLAAGIVEQVRRLVEPDAAALFLPGDDGAFAIRQAQGVQRADAAIVLARLTPSEVKELLEQPGATIASDLPRSRWRALALAADMQSAAFVPLTTQGAAVGFLVLNSRRAAAFTPAHESLLATFAVHTAIALENARLYRDLERMLTGVLMSLATALEAKDKYTEGHSARVAWYSVVIGKELGLPAEELETLHRAGLIHDIGKIGVGGSIIRKPGPLNESEWEKMRMHPVLGANIVSRIELLSSVVPGVRQHHEHWDGSGYPDGLRGEEIPLIARILSVADALDALLTDRSYRTGRPPARALAEIQGAAGRQFDPRVVDALTRCFHEIVDSDKERTDA